MIPPEELVRIPRLSSDPAGSTVTVKAGPPERRPLSEFGRLGRADLRIPPTVRKRRPIQRHSRPKPEDDRGKALSTAPLSQRKHVPHLRSSLGKGASAGGGASVKLMNQYTGNWGMSQVGSRTSLRLPWIQRRGAAPWPRGRGQGSRNLPRRNLRCRP